jgi:cytochrome c2
MKRSVYLLGLLFLAACSSKILSPTQADVDAMKETDPDLTLADLEAGKAAYKDYCNMCHGYYSPANYSEEQLEKIIPNMVGKVNEKSGSMVINDQMQRQLLQYALAVRN